MMEDDNNKKSPEKSTPSRSSFFGTAFSAVKHLFTPENNTNKTQQKSDKESSDTAILDISGLGKDFAGLKLNDTELLNESESFKTSQSRMDDSFESVTSNFEEEQSANSTVLVTTPILSLNLILNEGETANLTNDSFVHNSTPVSHSKMNPNSTLHVFKPDNVDVVCKKPPTGEDLICGVINKIVEVEKLGSGPKSCSNIQLNLDHAAMPPLLGSSDYDYFEVTVEPDSAVTPNNSPESPQSSVGLTENSPNYYFKGDMDELVASKTIDNNTFETLDFLTNCSIDNVGETAKIMSRSLENLFEKCSGLDIVSESQTMHQSLKIESKDSVVASIEGSLLSGSFEVSASAENRSELSENSFDLEHAKSVYQNLEKLELTSETDKSKEEGNNSMELLRISDKEPTNKAEILEKTAVEDFTVPGAVNRALKSPEIDSEKSLATCEDNSLEEEASAHTVFDETPSKDSTFTDRMIAKLIVALDERKIIDELEACANGQKVMSEDPETLLEKKEKENDISKNLLQAFKDSLSMSQKNETKKAGINRESAEGLVQVRSHVDSSQEITGNVSESLDAHKSLEKVEIISEKMKDFAGLDNYLEGPEGSPRKYITASQVEKSETEILNHSEQVPQCPEYETENSNSKITDRNDAEFADLQTHELNEEFMDNVLQSCETKPKPSNMSISEMTFFFQNLLETYCEATNSSENSESSLLNHDSQVITEDLTTSTSKTQQINSDLVEEPKEDISKQSFRNKEAAFLEKLESLVREPQNIVQLMNSPKCQEISETVAETHKKGLEEKVKEIEEDLKGVVGNEVTTNERPFYNLIDEPEKISPSKSSKRSNEEAQLELVETPKKLKVFERPQTVFLSPVTPTDICSKSSLEISVNSPGVLAEKLTTLLRISETPRKKLGYEEETDLEIKMRLKETVTSLKGVQREENEESTEILEGSEEAENFLERMENKCETSQDSSKVNPNENEETSEGHSTSSIRSIEESEKDISEMNINSETQPIEDESIVKDSSLNLLSAVNVSREIMIENNEVQLDFPEGDDYHIFKLKSFDINEAIIQSPTVNKKPRQSVLLKFDPLYQSNSMSALTVDDVMKELDSLSDPEIGLVHGDSDYSPPYHMAANNLSTILEISEKNSPNSTADILDSCGKILLADDHVSNSSKIAVKDERKESTPQFNVPRERHYLGISPFYLPNSVENRENTPPADFCNTSSLSTNKTFNVLKEVDQNMGLIWSGEQTHGDVSITKNLPKESLFKFDPFFEKITDDSTIYVSSITSPGKREGEKKESTTPESLKLKKAELQRLKELYLQQKRQQEEKEEEFESKIAEATNEQLMIQCKLDESEIRQRQLEKRLKKVERNCGVFELVKSEYEKVFNQLLKEQEEFAKDSEKSLTDLTKDHESVMTHLLNAESALIDVNSKYIKAAVNLKDLYESQAEGEKKLEELKNKLLTVHDEYSSLEQISRKDLTALELKKKQISEEFESNLTRLKAQVRKGELEVQNLQASLDHKVNENKKLAQFCEELIAGKK